MDVKTQMTIADKVLRKLEAIDPYCIVAGGAPRDWHFGKTAKDVDVFIYIHEKGRTFSSIKTQLAAAGLEIDVMKAGENIPENYKRNPDLVAVFDIAGYDIPVQVMVMNRSTFDCVVDHFPLSICKAWYKIPGMVDLDRDFKVGLKLGAIYKCNDLYGNADGYIERIVAKFPEFKFFDSKEELFYSLAK